ncbi:hypothetical protein V6N12_035558 [Hibiscus sabdariffa]|uniref:Uncharacterized protein n=1 Tax=Hibiscus sabdariffa TaxID=183260 RepID=A0ABR2EN30_9ROSI
MCISSSQMEREDCRELHGKKIIRRWEKESRQSQFHRNDLREESALGTINCPKNYNFHCKRRSCQRSTASHARLSTEYVYN